MKIKLISPKMGLRPMDTEFKRRMSPPLSLLVLAALTPTQHEVYLEDENVEKINLNDTPDLVGINVNVNTSGRAYAISDHYRSKGIPVVLGGIHPSSCPHEAIKHADAVCIGEAEELWETILSDVQQESLQNFYYNEFPTDLAKVPMPDLSLINPNKYLYTNITVASRGCPFSCEFCYNSSDYIHHVYRYRPIANIIEEVKRMEVRHVMFIDDNLAGDMIFFRQLIKELKPLNIKWNAAVTANLVMHTDLFDEMKESGCQSLFIGFETINQSSLDSVNKYQNSVAHYDKLISELHKRGIMINASLALGFDHDTPDTFENTLDWLVSHKIETMTAHILTPYPETKLFKQFEAQNRILDYDWEHYDTSNVVFRPKNMNPQELREGYLWMYKKFYSLLNIAKRLPDHKDQRISYLLFNLGYRKYGKLAAFLGKYGLMRFTGKVGRKLAYGV